MMVSMFSNKVFLKISIYLLVLFLAVLSLQGYTYAFSGCVAWASHCDGFSYRRAWALDTQASATVAQKLSSCGAWAQLPHGMWDLP